MSDTEIHLDWRDGAYDDLVLALAIAPGRGAGPAGHRWLTISVGFASAVIAFSSASPRAAIWCRWPAPWATAPSRAPAAGTRPATTSARSSAWRRHTS